MAKFRQRKLLAAIPSFLFMVLVFSLQPNGINAGPTLNKQPNLKEAQELLQENEHFKKTMCMASRFCDNAALLDGQIVNDLVREAVPSLSSSCTVSSAVCKQRDNYDEVSFDLTDGNRSETVSFTKIFPAPAARPRLDEDSRKIRTRSPSLRSTAAPSTLGGQQICDTLDAEMSSIQSTVYICKLFGTFRGTKLPLEDRTRDFQTNVSDYCRRTFNRKCTVSNIKCNIHNNDDTLSFQLENDGKPIQCSFTTRATPNGDEIEAEPSDAAGTDTTLDAPSTIVNISKHLRTDECAKNIIWKHWDETGDSKLPLHARAGKFKDDLTEYIYKTFNKPECTVSDVTFSEESTNEAVGFRLNDNSPNFLRFLYCRALTSVRTSSSTNVNRQVQGMDTSSPPPQTNPPADIKISTLNGQFHKMGISPPPPQTNPPDDSDQP
eukprot:GHVS01098096.1.p1 GENE.GHVS01098096.1~~GHVS01098096.1.p1  ORF type:complete len:460 (+),score=25.81 GHVS01098096.1:78-1382(+)